jgi:hypothetical protein
MSQNQEDNSSGGDPLIEEVRAIRRSICECFGNDVDRLCDHLQIVEQEYRDRVGRFADVPRKLDRDLFPEALAAQPDPLIDEVRSLRGSGSPGQS